MSINHVYFAPISEFVVRIIDVWGKVASVEKHQQFLQDFQGLYCTCVTQAQILFNFLVAFFTQSSMFWGLWSVIILQTSFQKVFNMPFFCSVVESFKKSLSNVLHMQRVYVLPMRTPDIRCLIVNAHIQWSPNDWDPWKRLANMTV